MCIKCSSSQIWVIILMAVTAVFAKPNLNARKPEVMPGKTLQQIERVKSQLEEFGRTYSHMTVLRAASNQKLTPTSQKNRDGLNPRLVADDGRLLRSARRIKRSSESGLAVSDDDTDAALIDASWVDNIRVSTSPRRIDDDLYQQDEPPSSRVESDLSSREYDPSSWHRQRAYQQTRLRSKSQSYLPPTFSGGLGQYSPSQSPATSMLLNSLSQAPSSGNACPNMRGKEMIMCPTPADMPHGRSYTTCIQTHQLCDSVQNCPGGEDEDTVACLFYKVTNKYLKATMDILADLSESVFQSRQNKRRHRHKHSRLQNDDPLDQMEDEL